MSEPNQKKSEFCGPSVNTTDTFVHNITRRTVFLYNQTPKYVDRSASDSEHATLQPRYISSDDPPLKAQIMYKIDFFPMGLLGPVTLAEAPVDTRIEAKSIAFVRLRRHLGLKVRIEYYTYHAEPTKVFLGDKFMGTVTMLKV